MLRSLTMTCAIQDILADRVHLTDEIEVVQYDPYMHREIVPQIYKRTFLSPAWGEMWDRFDGFYAEGIFLLFHKIDKYYVGFVVSYVDDGLPYIAALGVMAEFRGRHFGTFLVQNVAQHYAKLGYKELWVDIKPHSDSFYRRCIAMGFHCVDEGLEGSAEGGGKCVRP